MRAEYPTDELLVAGLRAGDEDAFAELLDRYDALLRRLARRFVASGAVADDVVGETWLAVVRGIDRFEGRSSLKTWLVRIMSNQAMTGWAREARTVPVSSLVGDGAPGGFDRSLFERGGRWSGHWLSQGWVDDWSRAPLDGVLAVELRAVIEHETARLPASQRAVFTLHDIEGWSSAEVADALQLTEGYQRVLLHRARSRVRAALDRYLASEGADDV